MRKILSKHWIALAVFSVATLAFVWPVIMEICSHVGGREFSELYGHLWSQWIFSHMLFSLHEHPCFISIMNAPEGLSMYPVDPFHVLLVALLKPLVGLIAAYNLLMIGTLFATMFAVYLLARYLSGSSWAGIGAGILVGLSPYMRSSYVDNYTESMALYWVAFVFYNLLVNSSKPTLRKGIIGGFLLTGLFYSSFYYSIITGISYVIIAGWTILFAPQNRRKLTICLSCAPLLCLLLSVPGILIFNNVESEIMNTGGDDIKIAEKIIEGDHHVNPESGFKAYSISKLIRKEKTWFQSGGPADIGAYLFPLRNTQLPDSKMLMHAVYPGVMLLLCLLVFLTMRQKCYGGLFLAALLAWLLSFGLFPRWHGEVFNIAGHPFPGPFYWLVRLVPFTGSFRQGYRFSAIVLIFGACGVAILASIMWRHSRLRICALLLMLLCLVDMLVFGMVPFPVPVVDVTPDPAFYWLKKQPKGIVLEWPTWNPRKGAQNRMAPEKPQYHQTIHEHALGPATDTDDKFWRDIAPGFYNDLEKEFSVKAHDDAAKFAEFGYRYFIYHKDMLDQPFKTRTSEYLTDCFGRPEYAGENIDIYVLKLNCGIETN